MEPTDVQPSAAWLVPAPTRRDERIATPRILSLILFKFIVPLSPKNETMMEQMNSPAPECTPIPDPDHSSFWDRANHSLQ
jgi:hypothetical protein